MFRELLPQGDARSRPHTVHLNADKAPGRVVVSDAQILFGGHFQKSGSDLIITGKDGHKVVIPGYFGHDKTPDLVTEHGASLSGHVVERLSLSSTPGQYA